VVYPLPDPLPLVTVIIPTKDKLGLLQPCVEDVLDKSTYKNIEVIIVDNGSHEPATLRYLKHIARHSKVKVLEHPGPFNYSAINNLAAKEARGSVLALLNNDIRVINKGWLEEMVAHALRPEIGAVGARLYYANDTVQHAGVFLGPRGLAAHFFRHAPRASMGQWARCVLTQNVSAVTAACLVVRKEVFDEIQGLSNDYAVTFNDVDFCLRIQERGYRNLYAPHAELYHLESATRGLLAHEHEENHFKEKWRQVISNDPAYNPNLTFDSEDLAPAFPPRVKKPWGEADLTQPVDVIGPLVSIVIRTHGEREHYLSEAIDSVCRQTYRPIEMLVVEDGPTKVSEVIKATSLPEGVAVRHIQLTKGGRCRAGNAGLQAASGKYAGFLDDDDLLLPNHVETLVAVLEKRGDIAAAYGNALEVPTRTVSLRPLVYEEGTARLFQGHPFSLAALWNYNYVSIQSVLFRRSLFERLGGLEEKLDCLEDWDLWLRYSAETDFAYADAVTSLFRVPDNQEVLEKRREQHHRYLPILRDRQKQLWHHYQGTPFENRLAAMMAVVETAMIAQPAQSEQAMSA
jgi:GT2 family glycosyltransferase